MSEYEYPNERHPYGMRPPRLELPPLDLSDVDLWWAELPSEPRYVDRAERAGFKPRSPKRRREPLL